MATSTSRPLLRQLYSYKRMIAVTPSMKTVVMRQIHGTSPVFEEVTHTGQKYDETDWKRGRFVDKVKLVNKNIAQDLVLEEAPIEVDDRVVYCDGGGGALGHPKVFINLDKPGTHPCGYCGLRFIKKAHH